MESDLFDKKISESLEQNENLLPTFANKEIVWKNIERKLQKSRRIKLFYYTAISAAACVALIIGFPHLFNAEQETIAEVFLNADDTDKTDSNGLYSVRNQETENIKDQEICENPRHLRSVRTTSAQSDSISEVMVAELIIPEPEEESPEMPENTENVVSQPNELVATIPKNEIKIRVSLSPGKQKNEKKEKIEFKLNNSKLNHYEDNTNYVAGTIVPFNLFRTTGHTYAD